MKVQIRLLIAMAALPLAVAAADWTSLFNGKDLTGWKVSTDSPSTFSVQDGAIVAHGPTAHCFYNGDFHNHTFSNFEVKVDVKAAHNSNGGFYVLTHYQDKGFPKTGFEIQVNNTYFKDPRKTGSIYAINDVHDQLVGDDTWFTEDITVKDKTITVKVNGKQVAQWTETDTPEEQKMLQGRKIEPGTFALQGHDPNSTVAYKNIMVKLLD